MLGGPVNEFPIRYLGLPLSTSPLSKKDLQPLVDRIARYIPSWKASLLKIGGRLILVNSTLMAAIIYHTLALDLPPWFLSCANKLRRAFCWCGQTDAMVGSSLVAWHVVCTPNNTAGWVCII